MLVIIFFIAIIPLVILFVLPNIRKTKPINAPPGPKGLPIIGNLHQFEPLNPPLYFSKLANIYGPIISLRLGSVPLVVVQSAKLAKEVLQTQDLNFCSRPPLIGMQKLSYNGSDISFCPYNDYFREIKKISVVHLFSSIRVESFAPIRQEEVSMMVKKISSLSSASEIVNLSEVLIRYACVNICRVAFGRRYDDDDGSKSKFHSLLHEAEALFIGFFVSDYLPYTRWIDKLSGQFSRLEKTFKKLDVFYDEIINEHLDPNKPKSEREDIIDVLLKLKSDPSSELTLDHIKAVLMDIFLAGTDTSSSTITWAMTELVKNPKTMKRVQEELRNAIQSKQYIERGDLMDLEYFKAVVKETFRLHPPAPMLIVHETINKTVVEGYDILPKTCVYVNVWAIGRDPESWDNPEEFIPERFLGSSVNYIGHDFTLIPFGAGRRMCPGLQLGVATVELALANLLYFFDWELPQGVMEEDIDYDVLPGITMHKKTPLCLLAKKIYETN